MSTLYPSDNKYGIPLLLRDDFTPNDLIMYGTEVVNSKKEIEGKTIHFFLDDYKFEPLWNKPLKTLPRIRNVGYALSPDFSLFTDYPLIVQMWNVYRSRYLARFWQDNGIRVIPSMSWSNEESYDFCFKGVEKNSPVAISTVGLRGKEPKEIFCKGFEEMCRQLEPSKLIVYGETEPLDFKSYIKEVHHYNTYWKNRRDTL